MNFGAEISTKKLVMNKPIESAIANGANLLMNAIQHIIPISDYNLLYVRRAKLDAGLFAAIFCC